MKILNQLFFKKSLNRSVILVDEKFQLAIINYVVLLFSGVIAVFYLANVLFVYSLKQKGIAAGLSESSEYFYFLENSSHQMNLFFLCSSLIVLLFIYYFGLRLSHRIAGPLYKIDKVVDEVVLTGEEKEIKLRKNDFFKDHATKINSLIKLKTK